MALNAGPPPPEKSEEEYHLEAGSMSEMIYQELNKLLSPPLQDNQDTLKKVQEGWKRLSYAIAQGVVAHLVNHAEVYEVKTRGDVTVTVAGNTGTQKDVTFEQVNGTGHLK